MSDARSAALPMPPAPGTALESRSRARITRVDLGSRLKKEGVLLVLLAVVFALSAAIPWLKSHHLFYAPPCVFYTVTHVPCFLCGMTRSFTYTVRGDFASAFQMHLLGPILFFLSAAAAAYLAVVVVSGYRLEVSLAPRTRRIVFWSVMAIFLICWAIKIAFMQGTW
jgi:Protein of unknown function (DUF2752)